MPQTSQIPIGNLTRPNKNTILMTVLDGLGGLFHPEKGGSELQVAQTPNLDKLAKSSSLGLTDPVAPGITPGSGPGHLALFGYDPIVHEIGRGVLEALGIGLQLTTDQIAARGNFCTLDENRKLVDRRAGRVNSKRATGLCERLNTIEIKGLTFNFHHVKDHRFVLILSGDGMSPEVTETDPQILGVPPVESKGISDQGAKTAQAINYITSEAQRILSGEVQANGILLRGFSSLPEMPDFGKIMHLRPAAIAAYPMYKGLAKLIGMTILPTGTSFREEIITLKQYRDEFDFFFLHYKATDTAGEDGDFEAKVSALEYFDQKLPEILAFGATVTIIAGDHSTPALLAGHSWHPVPFLLNSRWTSGSVNAVFSEEYCATGSIGRIPATSIMPLALAHSDKLNKFGP
jgi:2,3-bisphosphoglycerate-independent phosphoglycerate mutase